MPTIPAPESFINQDLVHVPAICCDTDDPAKVLGQHHKNNLRMPLHQWKRLGLQQPVSSNRNHHIPEQSHRNKRHVVKDTPMKASQAAVQRENEETNSFHCLSLNSSESGLSEGNESSKHSSLNTSGSSECHTDSDLSDQEQGRIEMSTWAAAVELDLKPESLDEHLDLDPYFRETAFYPEVLPASLLDSIQSVSSEIQENHFVTDPCLAPVLTRLVELERLQAATVQKEQAKLSRSRPATANTQNRNRLKKSELATCKTGTLKDAECNSVMHSFTKLIVCPSSSFKRRHTCPTTKSDQGSRSKLPHCTLPKHPDNVSGMCINVETVLPNFSASVKVPQKSTGPKRTKSPKRHSGSASAKKAIVPKKI